MSTQQIGAAGELLVQYQLLKMGIDSARMTTDAGVDLVVYGPRDPTRSESRAAVPQVSRRLLDARHVSTSHREILRLIPGASARDRSPIRRFPRAAQPGRRRGTDKPDLYGRACLLRQVVRR
jgi:hypothetical protein